MPTKKEIETKRERRLYEELITQLLTLVTSGFGVVAALAWNDAIQTFVKEFIEPRVPGSGIFYKFIYALLITILIVFITYQLSKIASRFNGK
jgi:hypothetical protein